MICEANYSDEDWPKARAKMHLTTRQAALIAASVKADKLEIFHISNLYANNPDERVREAEGFFASLAPLSPEALEHAIATELGR